MSTTTRPLFVAVAGNIGAGKSTLTRLLAEHFTWKPFYESVDDNPYLADFYGDMPRWSFHLQMYFLANRFKTHKKIVESGMSVIQDRSIYEDAEIFARNLFEMGRMTKRDYETYVSLFHVMMDYLKPPDLLVYLQASVDTLMGQIGKRGRDFEKNIERAYLEKLNQHYDDWIRQYDIGPVLTIPMDNMDFVSTRADLDTMISLVSGALPQFELFQKKRAPAQGEVNRP